MMKTTNAFDFFCSWSGGKDSCLSLYRMLREGHSCKTLLTVIEETGVHSRSHRLTKEALTMQAKSIGYPIEFPNTPWEGYESTFKQSLRQFKSHGIEHGAFGDIDLDPHKEWVERVCQSEDVIPHEPLWLGNRRELVSEFINEGFKARIIVVNTKRMPEEFLGRTIDDELACQLESIGVDACGENGEYHSFVFNGPLFSRPIKMDDCNIERDNEYAFLPLRVSQ